MRLTGAPQSAYRVRPRLLPAVFAGLGLILAGCAETQLVVHTAKRLTRPAPSEPPMAARTGTYKVGAPYQVDGVWYYPKVDYDYRATGIASWYGPGFDGRITANGEVYNQYALTAAHPTLPMPSIVRVTNLENGRSIKVRVNDRGPFKRGRIIDLSRRAAELLGFAHKGTAKVRIEIVADESRRLAAEALSVEAAAAAPQAVPLEAVEVAALEPGAPQRAADAAGDALARSDAGAAPSAVQTAAAVPGGRDLVEQRSVSPTAIYIQVGAFTRYDYANRLRARLSTLGEVRIVEAEVGERRFFRVRVGPVATVEEADRLLALLVANGHPEASVIVD